MPRELVIALAGNPSCGKTTLFNNLTGDCQNSPGGVTVEKQEGLCIYENYRFRIIDLPGAYTLSADSLDESAARSGILDARPDIVINVIDASNLDRNLYLTTQLLEMGVNLVICLNMIDRAQSRGLTIDTQKLSEYLGAQVIPTIGHRNRGTDLLLKAALEAAGRTPPNRPHIHYSSELEQEIAAIEAIIRRNKSLEQSYAPRWLSLKLLEGDELLARVATAFAGPDLASQVQASGERLKKAFSTDLETIIVNQRFSLAAGITRRVVSRPVEERLLFSDRIDTVLLHRRLGIPIFLFLIWLMFKITFTASEPFMHAIETAQTWLGRAVAGLLPDSGIAEGLVVDGVIGGVGSVLVFVPLIFILFFLMALLEDSGYMARVAFIMDNFMQKIGLHGKAFIPMVLGFGCNLPGLLATRTVETRRERFLTLMVVPFMSCSARIPIYALFIGAFFSRHGGTVLFSLYLIGILVAVAMAKFLGRVVYRGEPSPLLLELPPYQMPNLAGALRHTWNRGRLYLKKAGTVILGGCTLIWFLSNFPWSPQYSQDYRGQMQSAQSQWHSIAAQLEPGSAEYLAGEASFHQHLRALDSGMRSEKFARSYAAGLGRALEPLLSPLGFDWKVGVSLLTGIVGKEIFIGTMSTLYAVGETSTDSLSLRKAVQADTWPDGRKIYTPLTAFSLMVFCLLYIPCLSAIAIIFQETGSLKWTAFAATYTNAVAWLVSFVLYQGGRLLGLG